jgi:hypothetical protein
MNSCPSCRAPIIEPLFSLSVAAQLIPMRLRTLERWLSKYGDRISPAQYTWIDRKRRRLLPASDVLTIRRAVVSTVRWPESRRHALKALPETSAPVQVS